MKAMNYWDYIKVEALLSLQSGSDEDETQVGNDETLFIIVHQIYELWFKLILRELTAARDLLRQDPVPGHQITAGVRSLRRAIAVFEQANQHFRVMETMTTRDFLDFRERLTPASGFQSAQLREIEILLGLEDEERIAIGHACSFKDALKLPNGAASAATHRVEARIAHGPSFKQCLYEWLSRLPIDGSNEPAAAERFLHDYLRSMRDESRHRLQTAIDRGLGAEEVERLRARYQAQDANAEAYLLAEDDPGADVATRKKRRAVRAAMVFIESYRELPHLTWPREMLESVVELEQSMLIWRQRHARMVERMIGRRVGTGGSAGVDYLDQTALRYRVFSDLWTVRSLLLRKASLPAVRQRTHDAFAMEGLQ
ncbi:tryptophan 2,3-dioxygenase protein [Ralstonia solanacearum Po82]|uniref:Tryptophan 2,3-dioxygenase n=2 Tax=Ralstonia solanacearum TaxID=305 RepID=F6G6T1_RALS8|nr:tryptophan 2,3-dioxygenase protein [Ralstonia solanacearum Po82]AMP69001.1 tryptophan 2,3-dioxygenase [Ralstonia solanacearum]AMP74093.1 tryptophan 2,3-dioxygenase [Ralstonia solanacearum]OAI68547.1 tryptophan 2,3-dioxygenase [Ralstonia solanacearum]QJC25134.1 tryptophan 2,3-dioxygenase [Ralstonia solanacearum]